MEPIRSRGVDLSAHFPDASLRLDDPSKSDKPAHGRTLLDNLQRVALVQLQSGGSQYGAERACGAARASDDLAEVVFGDGQLDHLLTLVLVLVDGNLRGIIDQGFRDLLDQSLAV